MKFPLVGTGDRLAMADYQAVADRYKVPLAHVRAVAKVEAAGSGWSGRLIKALYEGHVCYRNATGKTRNALVRKGLAWPRWDRSRYARGTPAQHDRIRDAVKIAGDAGFKAASYGLGQVLGENAKMCGFDSAEEMVRYNLRGEAEQLDTMFRFIRGAKLMTALRRGQWKAFARGYNGPGYAKNRYDTKLAAAARLYTRSPAHGLDHNGNIAQRVAKPSEPDPNVRDVQKRLNALGYGPLQVDGWSGSRTRAAVLKFQEAHPDLKNDGIIGPNTMAALERAAERLEQRDTKQVAEATGTVKPAVLAGAGAVATAVPGLPWQVGVGVVVAAVAIIAGVILYRRWYASRFDQELEHDHNRAQGLVTEVEAWADRPREFARV